MTSAAPFSGSYAPTDVTFLLKPVAMAATDVAEKERLIQSGARHYSEMISREDLPDDEHLRLYRAALERNGARVAGDVTRLAAAIGAALPPPREIVLLSLARAGTPVGILLRRALARQGRRVSHYAISIIRGRGLDGAALSHVAARHDPADALFVDGWTGKGAIAAELHRSLAGAPQGFQPRLAVITDPAGWADYAASEEDYLIPCALLNAIGSGLISRTILNDAVVGPGDFHACLHYREHRARDLSRAFVDAVDGQARCLPPPPPLAPRDRDATRRRCAHFVAGLLDEPAADANLVKPGIAEATRALLRRVPAKLLLRDAADPDVRHLVRLAAAKGVTVAPLPPDAPFRAAALIRSLHARDRAA